MLSLFSFVLVNAFILGGAAPAAEPRQAAAPTVTIASPQATIVGIAGDVEQFAGVPFAQPPVAGLRLKPPQPITEPMGTIMATQNGKACPQFFFSTVLNDAIPTSEIGLLLDTPLFQKALDVGEDCLVLNIHRPKGTTATSKLPVLFWVRSLYIVSIELVQISLMIAVDFRRRLRTGLELYV